MTASITWPVFDTPYELPSSITWPVFDTPYELPSCYYYSTPSVLNAWVEEMWYGDRVHNLIYGLQSFDWDEPERTYEPSFRNSSASIITLVEHMPDTTPRYSPWDVMGQYCIYDVNAIHALHDVSDQVRRYSAVIPKREIKDEPHWFRHDRKVRR